ncbi:type I 3-dehydroquinate dehydratase [Xanthomonas sp. 3498]|uniref:type I 3-dehydroquinate dehydratase n=1 Tax=Xanthomonas sp. 3498 TaxID=2663863 RepID=UPI0017AA8424|nr:type I 3-dehydroquinate dehydratase [Xanthomonas sp. 3498]MBB5878553.1 3-dehydroquinate dehydratase-1 [Xanthomonas sp. 3498]
MPLFLSRLILLYCAGLLLASPLQAAAAVPPATAPASPPTAAPLPAPHVLQVRGLVIGAGLPKIIVPITAKDAEQALVQAQRIAASPDADMAEWRIDLMDSATDAAALAALGPRLAQALHGKPLLLTFRTKAEGGAVAIDDAAYGALYARLLEARFADLLDVEMFRDPAVVRQLVEQAHRQGVYVVMSSHDFHATPPVAEIVARLQRQQALGADVLKIAVMPRDPGDVLHLLDATWQMRQRSGQPLLTMAMGPLGAVSRLSGGTFGQSLTFGMLGSASAPGQIDAARLRQALDALQAAAPSK